MQRFLAILIILALLTVASSQVSAQAVVQERIKSVDACGLIVDQAGHGVPEATISAVRGGSVLASSTTLSDGSFSFVQSVNSQVEIQVRARGFAQAIVPVEHLGAGGGRRCRHPLYAVLSVGDGTSYLTVKKNKLPRSK